jgi:DNA-binding winged helix-turn-helix (wHTH) protein
MLLEHPGEAVTREELRARLWQNETFVDFDHSLNVAINKIREALCDSAEHPRFIETIPRTGYRFIAGVNFIPRMPAGAAKDSRPNAASVGIATQPATAQVAAVSRISVHPGQEGGIRGIAEALAQVLRSRREHIDPGGVAQIYLALGDKEQAFVWLEKCFATHSNYLSSLKVWPAYDPLRNDPRFLDLERRVKLIP